MRKLMVFWACLLLAGICGAEIITVDDDGPADFNNIQAAIDDSNDGDIIEVQPGTYTGEGNRDIDFWGKVITVRSIDPCDPNVVAATIIDCNGTEIEPHRGFYFHSGEPASSILDGITVTNGWQTDGGAIYCDSSSSTIRNCVIRNNSGAGIYCEDNSDCHIIKCIIKENTPDYYGRGIYCDDGSDATISNCTVVANESHGIYCEFGHPAITNCTIQDNKRCGIVYNSSNGTITDCTISGNEETGIRFDQWCDVVITGCTIRNNATGIGLGYTDEIVIENCKIQNNTRSGIECSNDDIIINNCWITGNFAEEGGGICCYPDAAPTITNCIIADNLALDVGGGIYCDDSEPKIVNCVIVNNEALGYGGGVYSEDYSNPRITNSIIWANRADFGNQIALWSYQGLEDTSRVTVRYCDIQGGRQSAYIDTGCTLSWGDGMIDVNPGFAFEGDYHLAGGSPCIDAGTNSPSGGLPAVDLDGNLRPLDGTGDGNSIADIGVYEFNTQKPSIALSAESVEFFMQESGLDPDDQILSIRNAGGNTLMWEIFEGCSWLEAIPSLGTSVGQVNDIVLDVNAAGLIHGDYICQLSIEDEQAINHPETVVVTLHINKTLHVPSAFNTIQVAIDAAVDGDIVLVGDGTYTGDGNKDLVFKGKDIIVRSKNGADNCIIDCQGQGRGFNLNCPVSKQSTIEGFTIMNGYTDSIGNGIRCSKYSYGTIKKCVVTNCNSMLNNTYGSGILCGCHTTVEDCTIENNKGGGICAFYNTTVINCTITQNYDGSGLTCRWGKPTIKYCTISNNKQRGVVLTSGDAVVKNCMIIGNAMTKNPAVGGGVECSRGSPTISNCLIAGNFAEMGGGGVFCYVDSSPKIINCVIIENRGSSFGGGISIMSDGNVNVRNSILRGNTAERGKQIDLYESDSSITVSFSDVQNGEDDIYAAPDSTIDWGFGNIDIDPCFVEAGYWDPNGTPGDANDDFWVDGDYHLQSAAGRWDPNLYRSSDFTGDGIVNLNDYAEFANFWFLEGENLPADLNRDGLVDGEDLCVFADKYLTNGNGGGWVFDLVTSRCIDAGNPGSLLGDEPLIIPRDPDNLYGRNLRINMGAYGGTVEASMPPYDWAILGDLTNDGTVDFDDLAGQVEDWLNSSSEQPGDLDRNGIIDMVDFALLGKDWLEETSWY